MSRRETRQTRWCSSTPGMIAVLLAVFLARATAPLGALDWEIGTRFGFETRPAGFDDPYGFSLGIGLFADVAPLDALPVRFGATLARYTFNSRRAPFADSAMPTPGVYLAYPLFRVIDDSMDWRIEPYIEYRHYRRTHRFFDTETTSRRPLTAVGLGVISVRRFGVSSGVAIEYQTVWDNAPVHRAAVLLRLGVRSQAPAGEWR